MYGRIRTDIPSIYDWASLFRLYEIGLLRLLYLYTQYIILQELLSEFRENELVIIYELKKVKFIMDEFFDWLIDQNNINANIFTLITVILSGLISWIISVIFYNKGNRENLKLSVIYPIKDILDEKHSWKNYNKLANIRNSYSTRYLKEEEKEVVNNLLKSYKDVCGYNYDYVCADSLFEYFKNKLKKNGIKINTEPINIEGEQVAYGMPFDLMYMHDDLERIVNINDPQFEAEVCQHNVVALFNSYCKKYFSHDDITYFDDISFDDVINKSDKSKEWDIRFKKLAEAKKAFQEMKVCQCTLVNNA